MNQAAKEKIAVGCIVVGVFFVCFWVAAVYLACPPTLGDAFGWTDWEPNPFWLLWSNPFCLLIGVVPLAVGGLIIAS